MNDDPRPTNSATGRPDDADDNGGGAQHVPGSSRRGGRSSGDDARRRKECRTKLQMLTQLLHNLDLVVAVEMCILYYLECSFFLLFIRVVVQTFFLSPKPAEFQNLMPTQQPHAYAIFGPNILCFLLHALAPLPKGSEAARGYLHGGVVVDFIGQKAPTSKLSLLALDLLIFALQCFMLAVHAEANKLRKIIRPGNNDPDPGASTTSAPAAATVEDLDAIERGERTSAPNPSAEADGIELQPLGRRRGSRNEDQDEDGDEDSQLLQDRTQRAGGPTYDDIRRSGNAVLGNFHVIHAVRTAGTTGSDYRDAAARSIQTLGYATTIARLAAANRTTVVAQPGRPLGP